MLSAPYTESVAFERRPCRCSLDGRLVLRAAARRPESPWSESLAGFEFAGLGFWTSSALVVYPWAGQPQDLRSGPVVMGTIPQLNARPWWPSFIFCQQEFLCEPILPNRTNSRTRSGSCAAAKRTVTSPDTAGPRTPLRLRAFRTKSTPPGPASTMTFITSNWFCGLSSPGWNSSAPPSVEPAAETPAGVASYLGRNWQMPPVEGKGRPSVKRSGNPGLPARRKELGGLGPSSLSEKVRR